MNAAFSFLISIGIIAFGIWIVAGTPPLAGLWLGRSWVCLPSLWVRSAFIKRLAISKSRS